MKGFIFDELKLVNIFSLKIRIRFDDLFKAKFGNESENVIRRIMAHAQNTWRWKESLTTELLFDIESVEYMPGNWNVQTDGR